MTSPDALDPDEILAHTDWLRALARRLVGGADADDLAQEAQIRALRSRVPVRNVRGYLGQVLRNVASRRSSRETLRRDREAVVAFERQAASSDPSPEDGRVELLEVCLRHLRSLPEAQRRAVTLRYLDGLSFEEIAAREGVRPATVRSNVSRGIEALRARLDEHAGSRAAWCMAIGPWAMGDLGVAGASALESLVPSVNATKGAASAASASAAAGAGVLAVMLKPITLALAGVIAGAAGWIALDREDPVDARTAELATGNRGATLPELASDRGADPEGPGALVKGGDPARVAAVEAPAPSASDALAPLTGRVVDELTGDPVPGAAVVLNVDDERVPCGRTDADGRFEASSRSLMAGPVTVALIEDLENAAPSVVAISRRRVDFPFEGPLTLRVGPTFTPRFAGHARPAEARFDVEARGPGIPVNRPLKAVFPRSDGATWLRFSAPFSQEPGEWTLSFRSRDGLWVGEARATRGFGIETAPLDVALEARGAAVFELEEDADPAATTLVTLTSDVLDAPRSIWMSNNDDRGGPQVGELDEEAGKVTLQHLVPGAYRWSVGSGAEAAGGRFTVVAGETVTVEVATARVAEGLAVPVDATAVPDADLSGWFVQFFRPEDVSKVFRSRFEPAPGGGGHWLVPLETLPEGEWKMAINTPEGFVARPLAVDVRAALRGDVTMRIEPVVQSTVTLRVDAGDASPRSISVQHVDGIVMRRVDGPAGGPYTATVPGDHPTVFLVAADGYDMTAVTYEPGRDAGTIEVDLEPGHRTRAWVLDVESLAPLKGIEIIVDGRSVGRTDAEGNVWFDAETAPSTIEIAPGSAEGLRQMMVPSTPDYGVDVGQLGYVFMVAKEG